MFRSLLLISSLLPFAASADNFYIEDMRQAGEVSDSVVNLVKSELTIKGHTVVTNKSNSQWVLVPNTIKLGSAYLVTLTKSQDGQVVYSDKLKSDNLDDLDIVTARLVSGALDNVTTRKNIAVDTVTKNEVTRTTAKTKVTRQTFLGFGPSKSANLGTSNSGVMFTAGALWNVDHQFSIRAGYSTNNVSKSPADMTSVAIGGHYYLNREQHAPYAVGLVGYTWAESHERESDDSWFRRGVAESGWGVEAGMGMHFYRTATVNIAAEATYKQAFFKVADDAPGSLGVKLIVLW